MIKINYQSDFTLAVTVADITGGVVTWPTDHAWSIHIRDAAGTCWKCGFDGTNYEDCAVENDTAYCYVNNPGYVPGMLNIMFYDAEPNSNFADNVNNQAYPISEKVLLWEGPSDDASSVVTALVPYYGLEQFAEIDTTETSESGAYNTITFRLVNGQSATLHVRNGLQGAEGPKGEQGNSGYTGAAGELEVVNNLTDGGATAALSAEQGKVLGQLLSTASQPFEPNATETGHYIVRIAENGYALGDIRTTGISNYEVRIYNVTEGQQLHITFSASIPSSAGAQCCGWYTTRDVAQMTSSTFTPVDECNKMLKFVIGQSYDIEVPAGITALVFSAYIGAEESVITYGGVGSRLSTMDANITDLQDNVTDINEDIDDIEEVLTITSDEEQTPDSTLADKYISPSESGHYNGDIVSFGSGTYEVEIYAVNEGERWNVYNNTSQSGLGALLWCLYSCDNAADISNASRVSSSGKIHQGETDTDITIPSTAKWLAVTWYTPATLRVSKVVTTQIDDAVSANTTAIAALQSEIANVQGAKMRIRRSGDNVYLAYNGGNGRELCYEFGSIYVAPQEGWGLKRVYEREVTRSNPVADTFADATILCSCVSTDMFGPLDIDGTWCGGAHKINVGGVDQSSNVVVSKTIVADSAAIASGDDVDCYNAEITVVNKILAPDGSDMADETITMHIEQNVMNVNVKHEFNYAGGVGRTIRKYYGMQSYFGALNSTLLLTPNGQHSHLTTEVASSMGFDKGDYPNFSRFIQRNTDGWCQSTWLNPAVGIGDHSEIADTDKIFVFPGNTGKAYHSLIANKVITAGMSYEWGGIYRWDYAEGFGISEDLSIQDYYFGGGGEAYTKAEIDALLAAKQATLVSGTNIKTFNNQSLLGSGNIEIQGSGGGQVQSDWAEADTDNPAYIKNKPTLATVATSGSYNDLSNKPSIPDTAQMVTKSELASYNPIIEDTRVNNTQSLTGNAPFASLNDGQRITLSDLKFTLVNSPTLNLTLSNGTQTGAIPMYCDYAGGSAMKTNWGGLVHVGASIELIFDATNSRWLCLSQLDTNTTYSALTQVKFNTSSTDNCVVSANLLRGNFYLKSEVDANVSGKADKRVAVSNSSLSASTYNLLGTTDAPAPTLPANYDAADEFVFSFTCATDNCVLTLPNGVKMSDGFDFEKDRKAGAKFQVSIQDGMAGYLVLSTN